MVGLEDRPKRSAEICIAEFHTYAVDWTSDRAEFFVDGGLVRSCPRPPSYPMQMMLAVFDFPQQSTGEDADAVPSLVVDSGTLAQACGAGRLLGAGASNRTSINVRGR